MDTNAAVPSGPAASERERQAEVERRREEIQDAIRRLNRLAETRQRASDSMLAFSNSIHAEIVRRLASGDHAGAEQLARTAPAGIPNATAHDTYRAYSQAPAQSLPDRPVMPDEARRDLWQAYKSNDAEFKETYRQTLRYFTETAIAIARTDGFEQAVAFARASGDRVLVNDVVHALEHRLQDLPAERPGTCLTQTP